MAQTVTINGQVYSDVPSIEVPLSTSGLASFYDISNSTVTASDMLSGVIAYNSNGAQIIGSIQSQAAQTIIPTTVDQTIASGKYLSGTQTIKGDANLLAENIADGITIFGITGTHKGGDIVIIGTNITVPIASWDTYIPATNTEEENIFDLGYQYRATVPLSNVTSDMFPIIVWSLYTLDESGADLIDLYQCTTGGVYIYADTIPEVPILALTVECRKENT